AEDCSPQAQGRAGSHPRPSRATARGARPNGPRATSSHLADARGRARSARSAQRLARGGSCTGAGAMKLLGFACLASLALVLPAAAQADVTITATCNGVGCSTGWYTTNV